MAYAGKVIRQFVEFLKTYLLVFKYFYFFIFLLFIFLIFYIFEQGYAHFVDDFFLDSVFSDNFFFTWMDDIVLYIGFFINSGILIASPVQIVQETYFLLDHLYELLDNDPKIDWAERVYPLLPSHPYYIEHPQLFEDLTPYMEFLEWEEDLYPAYEFFKSYRFTNFRLKYYRPPYAIMPMRGCEYEDSVFTHFKFKKKI